MCDKKNHRKTINDSLVQWIRRKVETEYADDIALVCIYGSWLNGTANHLSDVDCYFIPRTERGYGLSRTFILEDVGYDIFPMSWQRLEEVAALDSGMQPFVGDVMVLWQHSDEDLHRLQALQDSLRKNLQDSLCTLRAAEARCRRAAALLAGASPSRGRLIAGYAITQLAEALVLSKGEYFRFGTKRQHEDLCRLFPGPVSELFARVTQAPDGASTLEAARQLLERVLELLNLPPFPVQPEVLEIPAPGEIDAPSLAGLYQEICSTFNKIYLCCASGNYILAFLSAGVLQWDLDDARSLGLPPISLLDRFDYRNLEAFSQAAREAENTLRNFIISQGTRLRSYNSFPEFEAQEETL